MSEYVLPHSLPVEDRRLTLMSEMLDPYTCFRISQLGIQENWKCLEVAAGNGTVSHWLASQLGKGGEVRCTDIDIGFMNWIDVPNIKVERLDITKDEIGEGVYDLVVGRAFLHHLPSRHAVIDRLARAVKPGGAILLQEPDIHPTSATDNQAIRSLWESFTAWGRTKCIDYHVGRKIPWHMQDLGFEDIQVGGETVTFNGTSIGAEYYRLSMEALGPQMAESGYATQRELEDFDAMMRNPKCWAMLICFTATTARKPK